MKFIPYTKVGALAALASALLFTYAPPDVAQPSPSHRFELNAEQNLLSPMTQTQNTPPAPPAKQDTEEQSPTMKLEWDKWHKDFSRLSFKEYCKAMKSDRRLAGLHLKNFVRITVTSDGTVNVLLLQPSGNNTFDLDCLNIYQGLSGRRSLRFPKGSQRAQVSWTQHNTYGTVSSNQFNWIHGDVEQVGK